MNVILTTLKKELASYFFNPVAYVIAVLFYLFRGWEIHAQTRYLVAFGADADLYSMVYMFCNSTNFMIVLVPPILTMRCFAEERRTGSLEVLLTAPVRDLEIVLGKWLAAIAFFAVLWLPTLAVLWVLTWQPFVAMAIPFGPVLSGYFGLFLLGALFLAVGVFTSSYTDNLMLACLSAMLFNAVLLVAPKLLEPVVAGFAADNAWVLTIYEQLNVMSHLQHWFTRGLIDTSQIVFYAVGTFFFLFLTVKSLESRRWR